MESIQHESNPLDTGSIYDVDRRSYSFHEGKRGRWYCSQGEGWTFIADDAIWHEAKFAFADDVAKESLAILQKCLAESSREIPGQPVKVRPSTLI